MVLLPLKSPRFYLYWGSSCDTKRSHQRFVWVFRTLCDNISWISWSQFYLVCYFLSPLISRFSQSVCNCCRTKSIQSLQWRHNGRDGVSDHQPHHCLLNRLFMRRSKKTSSSASLAFVRGINRRPVNSPQKWPVTQKKVSIWWHHHDWNPSKQQGSGRNISYIRLTT